MEREFLNIDEVASYRAHAEKPSFLVQADVEGVLRSMKPDREIAVMIQRGEIDLIEDIGAPVQPEQGNVQNEIASTRGTINGSLRNTFPERADEFFKFLDNR
ncbi:MAG: hypothetical protein WCT32_03890 [Patescibacteria group bacterium]|jgi:hypothetical protein